MLILEMVNHVVRKVDAKSGTITTLAGDGVAGDRGDGGPALMARFRHPHSIQLDEQDNIYISDLENHRVRRIDARTGRIETIVGNGKNALPKDGGIAREDRFSLRRDWSYGGTIFGLHPYRGKACGDWI
jgi:hypothetical protein